MASLYQLHLQKWENGCGGSICPGANKRVYARGSLPCDILFIGEAPGESEDILGQPFRGPAGQLLDKIVAASIQGRYSYAMTNLVCCIPREEGGGKAAQPSNADIRACRPRLLDLVKIASPRLLVGVGSLAKRGIEGDRELSKIRSVSITHPAAILRSNVAMQGITIRRCIITISNAIEGL